MNCETPRLALRPNASIQTVSETGKPQIQGGQSQRRNGYRHTGARVFPPCDEHTALGCRSFLDGFEHLFEVPTVPIREARERAPQQLRASWSRDSVRSCGYVYEVSHSVPRALQGPQEDEAEVSEAASVPSLREAQRYDWDLAGGEGERSEPSGRSGTAPLKE